MGLNRKSATKLASLSALGAGALALTAENAEAGIIFSDPLDVRVGFSCGCDWNPFGGDILTGPNQVVGMSFRITGASTTVGPSAYQFFNGIKVGGAQISGTAPAYMQFATAPAPGGFHSLAPQRFLRLFAAGEIWPGTANTASATPWGSGPGVPLAHRRVDGRVISTLTTSGINTTSTLSITNNGSTFPDPLNPNNHYILFSFSDPTCGVGGRCYGWADVDLSFTEDGPNVIFKGWAYDDSGAFLPAGQVPEPSSFALTGIAALALGARGIRRWRARRDS